MSGYKNRLITLEFEEYSEPDDRVYVTIRNPKMVPLEWLVSRTPTGADGKPIDEEDARQEGYARLARLVVSWHVYDASSELEEQPLLPLPADAAAIAKLPYEIAAKLADEVGKVGDPTPTPGTPTS